MILDLLDLLCEGRTIQERLQNSKSENRDEAKIFLNLMMHGKLDAAVKMLLNLSTGIHSVDDKVLKELQN